MANLKANFFINGALLLGYFGGGLLGHWLIVPPYQVSPVWPSAGIALAGLLVYGNRALLGLILGAVLTQAYVFLPDSGSGREWTAWLPVFFIGTASTLQAWLGSWLIRRFVGRDDPLVEAGKIFRFMILAGPVSCLVAPSLGSTVLLYGGMIDADGFLRYWLIWWVGDTIGVIIFTPLIYLPFSQGKAFWKLRHRFITYPLLFLLVVLIALVEYSKRMEIGRLQTLFAQQVSVLHGEINQNLNQSIKTNWALKAFFDSSDSVDGGKFKQFAAALLAAHPTLLALEWTPRITHEQRAVLEGKGEFLIKGFDDQGRLVVSPDQAFYFPIRFVEPLQGNEKALGFDVSSNPNIRPVIKAAVARGITVATPGVRLVQDLKNQNLGIVLYTPVYQQNRPLTTELERERVFLGFVVSVFRVGDKLTSILQSLPIVQVWLSVKDSQAQGLLFSNRPEFTQETGYAMQLSDRRYLNFADRVWLIEYQPAADFFAMQRTSAVWWLLAGGFTLCAMTGLGALLLTGKTAGIAALVREKTGALRTANKHLRTEIAQRKQLQAQQEIKSQVLELLAQNRPLQTILDAITLSCESLYPGWCASIMRFDANRQTLHCASGPSLPDSYIQALEGLTLGPSVGSCGAAVFTKQTVVAEDLLNHPNWQPIRQIMLQTPFRACWSQPIVAADGRVLGTFAFYHSQPYAPGPCELEFVEQMAHVTAITIEHKDNEQELLIAATTFQSHEAILVTDHKNSILRVNQAFSDITGYSAAEVIGKNPKILASGIHDGHFYKAMYQSLTDTGRWEGEVWNRNKKGQIFPEWLTLTAVKNQAGETTHYVGIFSDISEIKAAEREIYDLAYYDSLTHLPNRRLLLERLGYEIDRAKTQRRYGALFFLDLDRFKNINDASGQAVGNELLVQVAERLKALVNEGDTVSRLSGDEFIVLVQGDSESVRQATESARVLAEHLLAAISLPYTVLAMSWHFTVSIGIALFPDAHESAESILQHADTAMYWAKESGRNGVRFFNPGMHEHADRRLTLERDLHKALQEGQLHMHYQSQVDHEGRLWGAEALVRWTHPDKGTMSPAEFIPLAEESHLIVLIGQWALTEVCQQVKAWQLQGNTIDHVAVNVSAKQFRQADFVDRVRFALENSDLDAERLMVELTESCVIENMPDTLAKMRCLQAMGVRISLDDFGIGYSSLLYLKNLPLSQLKIDKNFVGEVTCNSSDAVIVETIIHMAKNLGLDVVAEGVEKEDQLAFLRARGCLVYQGYYFAQPQPSSRFWLGWRKPPQGETDE